MSRIRVKVTSVVVAGLVAGCAFAATVPAAAGASAKPDKAILKAIL
jgi:hypothetical protein